MMELGMRLIGRHTGKERGTLMICLAGLHGNEKAGVRALELIFKMLEVEPIANPDFVFSGRLVGFKGNVAALTSNSRFQKTDLNRIWTPETIKFVLNAEIDTLDEEQIELRELLQAIHAEIEVYQPQKIVVLDLHTTSCKGGIFSIVRDDIESIELGIELHAPVIRGMLDGLDGTTLHYFQQKNFHIPITSITFEGGQHDDPLSINRCIAAIINCMRTTKNVMAEHVENHHDKLLIEHSENLPKVCQLNYCHRIQPGDEFIMKPGFKNFDVVINGMELARDINGPILAKSDGLLLMPLYQEQGSDGFFIIEKHDPRTLKSLVPDFQTRSSILGF